MEDEESNDSFGLKSPSAIDFYDYGELSDELEELSSESPSKADRANNEIEEYKKPASPPVVLETVGSVTCDEFINNSGKPLAGFLPSKLRDVDVHDIFPAFQEGKVLKFSALFGIGKPSNLPDIWRGVRKRVKDSAEVGPLEQRECEVEPDEEIKFLSHKERIPSGTSVASFESSKEADNLWRHGPAELWYDMAEVSLAAETYDYGMKVKDPCDESEHVEDDLSPDSFLMVTQTAWEDEVIWDGDEVKEKVMKNVYSFHKSCGWIPVNTERTVSSYLEQCKYTQTPSENASTVAHYTRISKWNSGLDKKFLTQPMFPEVNTDLLYDKWEDDVIWDAEAMPRISYPKNYVVDDSSIIRTIPDDEPPNPENAEPIKDRKEKKIRPLMKTDEENEEDASLISVKQDFFNISNDEYYNPKMTQETALKLNHGGSILQHSTPAMELRRPYFPTFIGELKLRRFHRPLLRQYARGPISKVDFHGVTCLTSHIRRREKERQQERDESGGGDMFFMRTAADLSGCDGDLVLFEFSEEHPPLMMQVGMASKIWNYYKRRPGTEVVMPDYKYGEISLCHTSPFLGKLQPGQSLQAYENNLFRAPIYEHSVSSTDFLIIRHKNGYYIRNIETIYTVGQQLPLVEVPTPKSEKASRFLYDFLLTYVYRAFKNSDEMPPKVRTDSIKKAFPQVRESLLRKGLSSCSDFQRTGADAKYWILKSNFRLPEEDEIREMVSPEQCCAYYCMLGAEQRLKDAGYGDKFLLEGENELQNKIDDEVKAAPWNTTQAFISAIKGKCLLELSGVADPTGCGEGFSYVKAPHKPQFLRDDGNAWNSKRAVRGTDADLRKLSMSQARRYLKDFNVSDRDIKNMTRWQIVDVIRTLSTNKAKSGEEGITQFARGNLYGHAEQSRRYKEECQRLFDLQNKVLASAENLSTDESSSSEDSDLEVVGKKLEDILTNKKTVKDLSHEAEEAGRKELQMLMSSNAPQEDSQKKTEKTDAPDYEGKILKIFRTYQDSTGKQYTRVETVRKPGVIELYVKINATKDKDFVRNYALDEEKREEMRKERRRLQDQLRRIKKNEMKVFGKDGLKRKHKYESQKETLKVRCGACGGAGHMRTNRACPLYQNSPSLPPIPVAMTEEQEEAEEFSGVNDVNLVKVDETKVSISKHLLNQIDEVRRKSLVIKIPKDAVSGSLRKKKSFDDSMSDYVYTPKSVKRKRVDPLVSINLLFEALIKYLKTLPESQAFWYPVTEKEAPGYKAIIDLPMDLITMKDKAQHHKYKSREDFVQDIQQIVDNSTLYNGVKNIFTISANALLERCFEKFKEDEEKYMELEKAINPLLDNDQVAFSYMLERIVTEHLKTVPESWPFHKPVDKRNAKNYYECIRYPMDLETLLKNCKANKYKTVRMFLADVELISSNSETFNGKESHFTKIAQTIVQACETALELYGEQLKNYESGIDKLDSLDPVDSCQSSPAKVKTNHTPKNRLPDRHNGLNLNGSADTDIFVDVESLTSPVKCLNEENNGTSDKSDIDVRDYKSEDSNMCLFPPASDFGQREGVASPLPSSQPQSLLNLNGINQPEESNADSFLCPPQHSFEPPCDNICDDLMLSESDSDDDPHELKF